MPKIKIALFTTLISLMSVNVAYAHAHLSSATPEPNGTVQGAPQTVTIDFTEELEPKASSIQVTDQNGTEVDTGTTHVDPADAKRLIVALKPLQPGIYKVTWNATATDTHKTRGTYTFKVTG
jgi:methionine-rich copper-binding protein CopC